MEALLTIGYEKADAEDFISTLVANEVDLLLDVRERAMSRRKGFAKTALRENLSNAGIAYRHEPRLGSPSTIRKELRRDGDYETFFEAYNSYLLNQSDLLDELAELPGRIVLLCYERAPSECHRSSVAKELVKRTGSTVKHLGVQTSHGRRNTKNKSAHSSQSVPAA